VIVWSPGLRERQLSELPEVSDQAAADSTDGPIRLLCALGLDTWKLARSWKHGPSVLLGAAELYDDDADARDCVARYLERHGLGQLADA
jgi:hypothetical protein